MKLRYEIKGCDERGWYYVIDYFGRGMSPCSMEVIGTLCNTKAEAIEEAEQFGKDHNFEMELKK